MPTYEYECDACKHEFEEFQSIMAEPLKKCPACGKKKLRRLIGGGAAVLFKGSGFYQTDYRSDSYRQSAKKDQQPSTSASGDGKTSGDSSTSGDSKPSTDSKASTTGASETSASKTSGEKKGKAGKSPKSES